MIPSNPATLACAKRPVRRLPTIPPIACVAKIYIQVNNKKFRRKKSVRRGHHHNQGGTLVEWRNCKQFHQERRKQPQRLQDEWLECVFFVANLLVGLTSTNETRGWGDCNETRDSSGAKTNSRPLLFNPVIPKHPSQATDRGSEVGDDASLDSAKVGREG